MEYRSLGQIGAANLSRVVGTLLMPQVLEAAGSIVASVHEFEVAQPPGEAIEHIVAAVPLEESFPLTRLGFALVGEQPYERVIGCGNAARLLFAVAIRVEEHGGRTRGYVTAQAWEGTSSSLSPSGAEALLDLMGHLNRAVQALSGQWVGVDMDALTRPRAGGAVQVIDAYIERLVQSLPVDRNVARTVGWGLTLSLALVAVLGWRIGGMGLGPVLLLLVVVLILGVVVDRMGRLQEQVPPGTQLPQEDVAQGEPDEGPRAQ